MGKTHWAVALLFLLFGTQAAAAERVFSMRLRDDPETLDWHRAQTSVAAYVLFNTMEGLVSWDEKSRIVPALAQAWSITDGGKVYTFHLKPGIKWSDGVALTAKDFVYSWKRLLSPVTGAPYAYFLFDIEGAQAFNKGTVKDFSAVGVKAIDDRTLQVRLVRPAPHWLHLPAFWVTFPLRQDIVEGLGSGWERPGNVVTVGPYKISQHDLGSRIVLRKNVQYHGTRGNIDQINLMIIPDDSVALRLYESGQLHFINDLTTVNLQKLKGRKDLRYFPILKTGYIGFVTNKYPFSLPAVRRAIAMAIDRSRIPGLLQGGQSAASSFVPPGLPGHSKTIGVSFNPPEARALLSSTGIAPSQVHVQLLVRNWDKSVRVAEFVKDQLKKNLGVECTLQKMDHKTFRAHLDLKTFPTFDNTWAADYPDADNFLSLFLSTSGNNMTGWGKVQYDEMILSAKNAQEPSSKEKISFTAQKLLQEQDAAIIPLYYDANNALVKDSVRNLSISSLGALYLRLVHLN